MEEVPLPLRISNVRHTWNAVKDRLPALTEFKTKRSRAEAAAYLLCFAGMLKSTEEALFTETEDFRGDIIRKYWSDLNALTKWLVANPDPAFQATARKNGRKYIQENADIGITIRCSDWKFMVYRALWDPKAQLTRELEDEEDDSLHEACL